MFPSDRTGVEYFEPQSITLNANTNTVTQRTQRIQYIILNVEF